MDETGSRHTDLFRTTVDLCAKIVYTKAEGLQTLSKAFDGKSPNFDYFFHNRAELLLDLADSLLDLKEQKQ